MSKTKYIKDNIKLNMSDDKTILHYTYYSEAPLHEYIARIIKKQQHLYACIQSYKFGLIDMLEYHHKQISSLNHTKKKEIHKNIQEYKDEETFEVKASDDTIKVHNYLKHFYKKEDIKNEYDVPKKYVQQYLNWLYTGYYGDFDYSIEFYSCGHQNKIFKEKYQYLVKNYIVNNKSAYAPYTDTCVKCYKYGLTELVKYFHEREQNSSGVTSLPSDNSESFAIQCNDGQIYAYKYLKTVTPIKSKYDYNKDVVETYIIWLMCRDICAFPYLNIINVCLSGIGDKEFQDKCKEKVKEFINKDKLSYSVVLNKLHDIKDIRTYIIRLVKSKMNEKQKLELFMKLNKTVAGKIFAEFL